ncbi:ATP-binding protein [Nocardia transvalensis]|nr:ATP-binding protein [Nocardia transvalensis]
MQPTWFIDGNLRWTRSGVVYAEWLLSGIEYGYRGLDDKNLARTLHKLLLRSLPGESLLMGICADLDPYAVVARMESGVDLDAHPAWAAECEATLDTLAEFRPGQRLYWLSVPLAHHTWRDRLSAAGRAAMISLTDLAGAPRQLPTPEQLAVRRHQAELIAANIPAYFRPVPVTPAQMAWLHQHNLQRGLSMDLDMPPSRYPGREKTNAAFPAPLLDEGAQSDRPDHPWRARRIPTFSRVVKISQPSAVEPPPPSYQAILALADTPAGGEDFPGSEFLGLADDLPGVDVDWAILLAVRGRDEVLKANQRALINLQDQYHQRSGELSHGHSMLDAAAEDLAEYAAELEADHNEVEVQASFLFALGAPTEEAAAQNARALARTFDASHYRLVQPLGRQCDLWWAMTPGAPRPRMLDDYLQITTSTHFSGYVPLVSAEVGDTSGPLLALNISSPRVGVVHHDVASKSGSDVSGSIGVCGNLGSGKSVFIKTVAGAFVDRGGQVVVVDHTQLGEYASWAKTITDATIVDPSQSSWSIDPLRVFAPRRGAEVAASILLPLLQIQPDDDFGLLLTSVLTADYRAAHGLLGGGLYELTEHLATDCSDPCAPKLAKKLGVYRDQSYAASLFSPDPPPLVTTSPAIVFRTHLVQLPSQSQIEQAHLFKELPLEKRVGRALYALIAHYARELCFGDPTTPAMYVLDECHRSTRSEEGLEVCIEFVREGRKENAFILLGSQDPDEGMGSETLRGLIPTKVAMRQQNLPLARKSLAFVGLDPDDPGLLKELMEETSPVAGKDPQTGREYVEPARRGEGYLRDAWGNVARIKVLPPSSPARRAAVMTTPTEQRRRASTLVSL